MTVEVWSKLPAPNVERIARLFSWLVQEIQDGGPSKSMVATLRTLIDAHTADPESPKVRAMLDILGEYEASDAEYRKIDHERDRLEGETSKLRAARDSIHDRLRIAADAVSQEVKAVTKTRGRGNRRAKR